MLPILALRSSSPLPLPALRSSSPLPALRSSSPSRAAPPAFLSRRDLRLAAKALARRGWVPVALVGKRPAVAGWPQATLETWESYWTQAIENVGVLTGPPSGLFVVDVDQGKGGMQRWQELVAAHGEPNTVCVQTGGGGLHYYFLWDERAAEFATGIGCVLAADGMTRVGIDVRAKDGQVVAPPSIHPQTGRPYEFLPAHAGPSTTEPPARAVTALPEWLYAELKKAAPVALAGAARKRGPITKQWWQ